MCLCQPNEFLFLLNVCVLFLFTVLLFVCSFKCLVASVCVCTQCVAPVRLRLCMFVIVFSFCGVWLLVWYLMHLMLFIFAVCVYSRYVCCCVDSGCAWFCVVVVLCVC